MKKTFILLKNISKGDLNIFRFSNDSNNNFKKIIGPLLISLLLMYSVGYYAYSVGKVLSTINMTYIMLSIFIILSIVITFFECSYKTQSILFKSKDDDLLLSLPIKKESILTARILKTIIFQYLINIIFLVPVYIVYIYFEHPLISFYLISILFFFLLPLIPTILGTIVGYFVMVLTSKSKMKSIMQVIYSLLFAFLIMYFSFNTQNYLNELSTNAVNINVILFKSFYPLKLYINLINNFDFLSLIKLILVNVLPFILVIYLLGIKYFTILSNLKNNNLKTMKYNTNMNKETNYKKALIKKEYKRYISSPVYVYNTIFGLLILLIMTIALCIDYNGIINLIMQGQEFNFDLINMYLPKYYLGLLTFTICLTCITASSISMEGKSFDYTKTLPISEKNIFKSKVDFSLLLMYPFLLVSDLIFIVFFKINVIDIAFIFSYSIVLPILVSYTGLLLNLYYPKLNYKDEAEVVKQSISTMYSTLGGMLFVVLLIISIIKLQNYVSLNYSFIIVLFLLIVITFIMKKILFNKGVKLYKKLYYN
jgi:ABC-2 type transport system permease protein